MKRRVFLGALAGGIVMTVAKLNSFEQLSDMFKKNSKGKMPSLFIGHGNPMNAIDDNSYTQSLSNLAGKMEKPSAILCISAHWLTRGTWVTHMENPKTIHDFGGFPQALFDIQYPAPGQPELAQKIQNEVSSTSIKLDSNQWGLDHGTWAVIKHMYPEANIPVVQLSIDMSKPSEYHVKLGQELSKLREQGVLILGSGNIVHSLPQINWSKNAKPFDWAIEFDQWTKEKLEKRDFNALKEDYLKSEAGRLSNPTIDHYLPLLYIIGSSSSNDELRFEYEEIQNSSMSMRSFSFGRV